MQNNVSSVLAKFEAHVDSFDFHAAMLRSDLFVENGLTLDDDFTELEHLNVLINAVVDGVDQLGVNPVVEVYLDEDGIQNFCIGVVHDGEDFVLTGDFSFTDGSWKKAVIGFKSALLTTLSALLSFC